MVNSFATEGAFLESERSMKKCCYATPLRGPQHLMDLCGETLPRTWSLLQLSEHDEIMEICTVDMQSLFTMKQENNYVICYYNQALELKPEITAQLPTSEFMRDILIFNETHWKSALCYSESCCPAGGKRYIPQVTTCKAIRLWQDALADWIFDTFDNPNLELINTLENLDVRDWLLSRAISAGQNDWYDFLCFLAHHHESVALFTIIAGFEFSKGNDERTQNFLQKASAVKHDYPLLALLQRGFASAMPRDVLVQSLTRFETTKQQIQCAHEASLSPKASPPTATRTGER